MERQMPFNPAEVRNLSKPEKDSNHIQITIIGGSELFHGAPLLSLKVASRIAGMVFFSSPDSSVGEVAAHLKSQLFSFIWVPWGEVGTYIEKSDACLIGPGLMRYRKGTTPVNDEAWMKTREITRSILTNYKDRRWVIDAGSLQVLEKPWIPKGAILTPNVKEYDNLFGDMDPITASRKYNCTIILKGAVDEICSKGKCISVSRGNVGMAKGGTGDTLAGLTVALLAKNEPFLAASCASFITKKAGDELFKKMGTNFNADDLAQKVPEVLGNFQR